MKIIAATVKERTVNKMRLIDADALVELFSERGHEYRKEHSYSKAREADAAQCIVRQTPTIEAEPVRHGYWKVHITSCRMYFECSECKKLFSNPLWMFDNDNKQLRDFMEEDNAYCRGCGSKMNGRR